MNGVTEPKKRHRYCNACRCRRPQEGGRYLGSTAAGEQRWTCGRCFARHDPKLLSELLERALPFVTDFNLHAEIRRVMSIPDFD